MSKKSTRTKAAERAARTQALLEQKRKEERRRQLVVGGAVVAVLAVVLVVGVLVFRSVDTTGDRPEAVPSGVDGFGIMVGESGAPTTVKIYEDFQCPACAQFEASTTEQLDAAIEEGRVQVDYRLVSFLDNASSNEYSSRAMNAALAVLDTAGVEAFKEFHDILFANQPAEGGEGWSDAQLIQYAVQSGAEEDAIRADVEDKAYEQWIENATDRMSRDGVTGTPTVFVDGERVDGDPAQALQDALGETSR